VSERSHLRNFLLLWLGLTVVLEVVVVVILGHDIPPGSMTNDTRAQHDVIVTLTAIALPVLAMVWTSRVRRRQLPRER